MLCGEQNKRGGRVKLQSIILPSMEFANAEKGDALYGECVSHALSSFGASRHELFPHGCCGW